IHLALKPAEAVMVGDTPYDLAAAAQLGLPTIALRCGGFADESLMGAAELYDDPQDLLEHLDRSLLGRSQAAPETTRA
ncbi:HAD hydrolase-like protein, partial [Escherichia coli]|nr:HAD hydrolase-like protein [Escherichia coli]